VTRKRWLLVPVLAIAAAGCHSNCCSKRGTTAAPPPGAVFMPGGPTPVLGPPIGAAPGAPPSQILMPGSPPGVAPAPAPDAFSTPLAPSTSGFQTVPPNLSRSAYIGLPPNLAPMAPPANTPSVRQPVVRLLAPQLGESTTSEKPTAPAAPAPASSATLPAGIPDFAPALSDRVANGRKPFLDGLDWLKANGYRGAILLRRPNEPDAADRKQFEQRGMTFASLAVSPETLSRTTVEEFARLVANPSAQPLFVYDANGSLTGPLWYLYFRKVERISDDAARIRAGRLGLREPIDADARAMWDAMRRVN
jgi:protein tyrosine phosphatase (PTP) superfamily phosphohydrolase (DUF442 family)